jgi:DNA-binding MarR family transcriptional regulator
VPDKPAKSKNTTNAPPEVDFDCLPGLIGYQLRRAQVRVFNDFLETMQDMGVTPGQFGVISIIGANPGLSQSALARAVGIERSTIVAVIDRLEAMGLASRQPSPTDRRSHALVLSNEGRAVLTRAKELVVDHEGRITEDFTPGERTQLIDLLQRLAVEPD